MKEYPVCIKLKTTNVFDSVARMQEIRTIQEYLDELTEWQPKMYSMKYLKSHYSIEVWFKEEQHAVMCALRWV